MRSLSTNDTNRSSTDGSTATARLTVRPRAQELRDCGRVGPARNNDQPQAGAGAHHLLDRVPVAERLGGGAGIVGGDLDDDASEIASLDVRRRTKSWPRSTGWPSRTVRSTMRAVMRGLMSTFVASMGPVTLTPAGVSASRRDAHVAGRPTVTTSAAAATTL